MFTLNRNSFSEETRLLIVQCDFDDTITVGNVSVAIREKFGPENWALMEEEYASSRYSVEESNIRQFALIKATREEIEEFVVRETVVREGFNEFVEYCEKAGARLVIVSSGLDIYIRPIIEKLGLIVLEVYSAKSSVTPQGIEVEYASPSGKTITRGFKEAYTRHYKQKGNTVAYIGDGISDVVPATEADFVMARSTLLEHFRKEGLACSEFDTFEDVRRHVGEIIELFRE